MDEHATSYYEAGRELGRLAGPSWLELARTQELLMRVLPEAPARVLDIGGGPGIYAAWLAGLGYDVHVIDPVALHVEEAVKDGRFTAAIGDARALAEADDSFDVVLLLGPLYHLTERADRVAALREARRVLQTEGLLAAAAISRFASLLDGVARRALDDSTIAAIVEHDLREGQHRNPDDVPGWFTTAFFHLPEELAAEITEAGLVLDAIYGVEGATGWLAAPAEELEPDEREVIVSAARSIEREPSLLGASAHLLGIAYERSN